MCAISATRPRPVATVSRLRDGSSGIGRGRADLWRRVALMVSIVASAATAPSSIRAADTAPTDTDRRAAYCMQADFGFARSYSMQVYALQHDRDQAQQLLKEPTTSDAKRATIEASLKSLDAEIAATQAKLKLRQGDLTKITDYLKGRGLLNGEGLRYVISVGEEAQNDQRTVTDSLEACAARCTADDGACRRSCAVTASSSVLR
jgi:hypothetical protein